VSIEINKADSSQIVFWSREKASYEVEKVYGDGPLRWVYQTALGQKLADLVLSKTWVSQVYGAYQSSGLSRRKIAPFIRTFEIKMEEFDRGPFSSFNDFFIRQFKSGARSFVQDQHRMAAFAEARYLAFEKIHLEQKFPVKGKFLNAEALLAGTHWVERFAEGPLLLARLCPTDYHRFHFPDSGKVIESFRLSGRLHSVNPLALQARNDIFATNERQVTILETQNFGTLAYIEVGALCVGKIVQTHSGSKSFGRGEEKGYFLFGGSTVIVLGEAGRWKPDADLLDQTQKGRETLVRLGDSVASRK
jgi:phosphatidylserine decarboxylase